MLNKLITLKLALIVAGLVLGSFVFSYEAFAQSVDISAADTDIQRNSGTTLFWSSTDATDCVASGGAGSWAGPRLTSGSMGTGSLANTTIFTIACSNNFGSASDSVTINVSGEYTQEPTVNISADNTNLAYNAATNIRWSSNNATSCNASGGTNGWAGSKALSGFIGTGSLANTVTYTITCSNDIGSKSDSVTINIGGSMSISNPVTVDIWADDTSLGYNLSTIVRWTSTNAANCRSSDGTNNWSSASRNTSGLFYTGNLTDRTTYTITCYNSNNSSFRSDSVAINVSRQPAVAQSNITASTSLPPISQTAALPIPNKKLSSNKETSANAATAAIDLGIFTNSIIGWLITIVLILLIIILIRNIIERREKTNISAVK